MARSSAPTRASASRTRLVKAAKPSQPQPGAVEPDLYAAASALRVVFGQYSKGRDVTELEGAAQGAQIVRAKLNGGVFPDQV